MTKLQLLLEEANCLQYSATAIIESLQKNPEALAAVALTLGEISNLVTKMAPGILTAMKASFPAAVALLASPQFMIAAGVGVGVTVIALGGYKIIKKIKAKKELEGDGQGTGVDDELHELDRIEMWRRGIAEAEAESIAGGGVGTGTGTSVEGEFVTPMAGRRLLEEGTIKPGDLVETKLAAQAEKDRLKRAKTERKRAEKAGEKEKEKEKAEKEKIKRSASSSARSSFERGEKAEKPKKKETGGLKMLFKTKAEAA